MPVLSTLTGIQPYLIAERSEATPGLFNNLVSIVSQNVDQINSDAFALSAAAPPGALNAASLPGSGVSQIQAAINKAGSLAIPIVYLPTNLLPYDASQISFIWPVQMVREGGDWSLYDVRAYGAYGDGTHNDSAAVQGAINGASDGGVVYLSAGTYLVSNLTSYGFANFQGSGRRGRLYNTTSGSTTLAFTRHPSLTTYRNQEGNLDGIHVQDLYFSSSRVTDVQALWLSRTDHSVFENLTFEAINGPAIHLAGMVRESQFYNTTTRWCGQSAQTGAILIDDADSQSVEGTNEVKWFGTNVIYSFGPSVEILTSASSYSNLENKTRKIYFIGYQFHGSIRNGPNFNGPAPQPDSALTHSLVTLGSCHDIYFIGGSLTAAGQAAAFFALQPGTSGVTASGATNVVILGATTGGHTAPSTGTVATFNSGVSIGPFCEVILDTVHIDNSTRDIVAASGSSLHLGLNVVLQGASSISSTAYEPANRLTGVFAPRAGEPLFITGATRLQTQTLREDTGAGPLRLDAGQDSVTNSFIIRTPDSTGSLNVVDRLYVGSGSAITVHILSRTSIDGLLIAGGAITASGGQLEATVNGIRVPSGTAVIPAFRFNSEDSLGWYRSGASVMALSFGTMSASGVSASGVSVGGNGILAAATIDASAGGFRAVSGNASGGAYRFRTEDALGWYRSASSTMALSYGTLDLTGSGAVVSIASLRIKSGVNNSCGTATLGSNGSVNVANTYVAANDLIFLTDQSPGGTLGDIELGGIRAGSGFTIQSTSLTDTSLVAWLIVRPT